MSRKEDHLAGYSVKKRIGGGGSGVVFEASRLGCDFALKKVDLGKCLGARELMVIPHIKHLSHAHLMPVLELHFLDDSCQEVSSPDLAKWLVIVMPLAEKTLRDVFDECRRRQQIGIPQPELLQFTEGIAHGLDFLHAAGAVHRDVKPTNMLLLNGAAKLADFGAAHLKPKDGIDVWTRPLGTEEFTPPELLDGYPGPPGDQYALALSFQQMLTGQQPFKGAARLNVLAAHLNGSLDFSHLERSVRKVITKATSWNPAKRFSSCAEMVDALRAACNNAKRETWFKRTWKSSCVLKAIPSRLRELARKQTSESRRRSAQSIVSADQSAGVPLPGPKVQVLGQLDVGYFFYKGLGVAKDHLKAYQAFSEASQLGNVVALNNLGVMLIRGEAPSQIGAKRGVDCLWRSAIFGYERAAWNLTQYYRDRNDELAFQLASIVADKETPSANKGRQLQALREHYYE